MNSCREVVGYVSVVLDAQELNPNLKETIQDFLTNSERMNHNVTIDGNKHVLHVVKFLDFEAEPGVIENARLDKTVFRIKSTMRILNTLDGTNVRAVVQSDNPVIIGAQSGPVTILIPKTTDCIDSSKFIVSDNKTIIDKTTNRSLEVGDEVIIHVLEHRIFPFQDNIQILGMLVSFYDDQQDDHNYYDFDNGDLDDKQQTDDDSGSDSDECVE